MDIGTIEGQQDATVFLWVRLRNSGADSIADNYKLHVMFVDGTEEEEALTALPDKITFTDKHVSMKDVIAGSLMEKTAEIPIARGAARSGILMFATKAPTKKLTEERTKYTLSFNDVLGNSSSTVFISSKANNFSAPRRVPGTPQMTPVK
jgi:hypothetical protein